MVYVPAGKFTMGSDFQGLAERPEHHVYLDGFWIGKNDVTVAQCTRLLRSYGAHIRLGHEQALVGLERRTPHGQRDLVRGSGLLQVGGLRPSH